MVTVLERVIYDLRAGGWSEFKIFLCALGKESFRSLDSGSQRCGCKFAALCRAAAALFSRKASTVMR